MVMLRRVLDDKADRDLLIETVDLPVLEIRTHFESETVERDHQRLALGKEVAGSTVGIRLLCSYLFPSSVVGLKVESNGYVGGGSADRDVENMCRYSTHSDKSFLSRISVIFSCSRAAFTISVSRSFARRSRQMSSISAALLPVAHTMKMNPNFS